MSWKLRFDELAAQYGLAQQDFYLLDLVPLVEAIWADGKNPYEELRLLYEFAVKHAANLSQATGGMDVVSEADINSFLDRFAHQRPPQGLLLELRKIVVEMFFERTNTAAVRQDMATVLDYCLEIAAATVSDESSGVQKRFVQSERDLLRELMSSLNMPTDRVWVS